MKNIMTVLGGVLMLSSLFLFSGCASSDTGAAGAGTSGGSQAVGGPGHGPEGAMNGTSQ